MKPLITAVLTLLFLAVEYFLIHFRTNNDSLNIIREIGIVATILIYVLGMKLFINHGRPIQYKKLLYTFTVIIVIVPIVLYFTLR